MEPEQLTAEDVAGMSPDQIVKALAGGRLRAYLAGGRSPLAGWSPERIVRARESGELDGYLKGGELAPEPPPRAVVKGGVPLS